MNWTRSIVWPRVWRIRSATTRKRASCKNWFARKVRVLGCARFARIDLRRSDELNGEIQNEKVWSRELDEKLHEWEKKFHRKQMETGGANVSTTFNVNARRQERVLENRLDTVRIYRRQGYEDGCGRLFRRSSGSTRSSSRTLRRVRKSIPYAWRDNATKISIRSLKRACGTYAKNCWNASNARSTPTTYGRVHDEHGMGVRLAIFVLERTPTRRPSFCRVSDAFEIK